MGKRYFILFLRHEWNGHNGKEYKDFFGGVFSSHPKASAAGRKQIAAEPDFYCRFYVASCDLDKTV